MESHDRELIRKYIAGECSEAERKHIARLLADPAYQSLFEETLAEEGDPVARTDDATDEQMQRWAQKIQQRIRQGGFNAPEKPRPLWNPSYYRYAAVWLLALLTVAGTGYLLFKGNPKDAYTVTSNEGHSPLSLLLADSSIVILGPGSTLHYPATFAADSRTVFLEGEAFFQVRKHAQKPFFVNTGDVRTQVLGTSFKVTAFRERPTSVAVATGKVRVDHLADNTPQELAVLAPGQQVTYLDGEVAYNEVSVSQLESWQEGLLVYHDTPLAHITEDLQHWYGITVNYQRPNLAELRLDMKIKTRATLESTMRLLASTGGFTYHIAGKTVTIK